MATEKFRMIKSVSIWSKVVVAATFILFVAALFTKGFTHDLFLEGAVFLVSVKLIILSNENRRLSQEIYQQVSELHACMCRPDSN
jgi:hypothetical protein